MDIQAATGYFEPASDVLKYARAAVEFVCVTVMFLAPCLCYYYLTTETSRQRSKPFIGEGVIRFLALAEIIPAIVILGLGGILDKASAGTLLAGVSGYVLGSMGDRHGSGGNYPPGSQARRKNDGPVPNSPSEDINDVTIAPETVDIPMEAFRPEVRRRAHLGDDD